MHEVGGVGASAPLLAGHAVHHVGHPDGVGLQVGDAEVRELVEDALQEHAGELDHDGERVLQHVGEGDAAVEVDAEADRRRAVDGEGHVQPLRLLVEGPEQLVAEGAADAHVGAVGREHAADHAEFGDAAAQLLHGGVDVLQGEQGDAYEAGVDLAVGGVEPAVVAAADGHSPVRVLDHADAQPRGGVEDGVVEADLVEEPLPGADVDDALPALVSARRRAERSALEAVQRGEERVVERDLGRAVGLIEVLPYLGVGLADVAVAVYRPERRAVHV